MSTAHANPYAAPALTPAHSNVQSAYRGIGRLAYFGYTFIAGIVYQMFLRTALGISEFGRAAAPSEADSTLALTVLGMALLYIAVLMYCVGQRMINMGSSPWWCLAMFIPLLNIFLGMQCIICPAGFAHHRTLDGPGKTVLGIFVFFFVMFASMIVGLMVIGSQ